MSWYTITRACGHEDEVDIRGTDAHGERARKADWLAQDDCYACKRAARQDRQDQLNARAAELAGAEGWPRLTGSPKQIAWAQDLRATMIAALVDECGDRDDIAAPLIAAILRNTAASWWIDRRGLAKPIRTAVDRLGEPGAARHNYRSLRAQAEASMTDAEREQLAAAEAPEDPADPAETTPDTPQAAIGALRTAGWTVAKLAAEIGVHRCTVYRWAAGTNPNPANRAALALITRS